MKRLAARIILLWGWQRALAAFAAGAFLVFALAPFDFPAIGFVSFTVLVWLLDGAAGDPQAGIVGRLRPAFATGWWFGFGYFVSGLWWIGNALLVEAEAFAWALPLAVVVLPAALAIFHGAATVMARIWWREGPSRIAALAVSFALAEWARASWFTGFPWNPVGFAAAPVPVMMQSASVVGVLALNAIAIFVFAMPAILVSARFRRTGAVCAIAVAVVHVGFGAVRLGLDSEKTEAVLTIRVVQPSILQTEKWDEEQRNENFNLLLDLTRKPVRADNPKPSVIVWPETAVPYLLTERPDALAAIGELLLQGQHLLTGAVRVEAGATAAGKARFYNSIVVIDDLGEIVGAADKRHLVPFGEYLPFAEQLNTLGLRRLVEGPGSFSAGATFSPLEIADGLKALPFVCYELIFSDPTIRAGDSALAVIVTNDAWYGNTPGPYQHLRHAQIRAVELGLPVVRSANNGVSAAIDTHGRILDGLELNSRDIIDISMATGAIETLYATTAGWIGHALLGVFAAFSLVTGLTRRLSAD